MNRVAAVVSRILARPLWQSAALLFLIAFAIRLAGVAVLHQYRDQEKFELERVAVSLAQTGVFGNPYYLPTGPTAHVSPGYPLLLAGIYRLFGTGTTAEIVKQVFACASAALVCSLIPFAARAFQFPAVTGFGAALFAALLPVKIKSETLGDWESPFAALGLILVLSLTAIAWRQKRFDGKFSLLCGFTWGITLLFVSAYLPLFFALFVTGLFITWRTARRAYLRHVAILYLCVAACVAPWAYRNQRQLGSAIFTRDNTGIELRVSNNPYAGPDEGENFQKGVYHRYHPLQSPVEAAKVLSMGEIAYNRMAVADATHWIKENPSQFVLLSLKRFRYYWFLGDFRSIGKAVFFGSYTILGFLGVYYLWRRNRLDFALVMTVLIVVPLPSYLIHMNTKHRYPIDWLLMLLAAFALHEWFSRSTSPAR